MADMGADDPRKYLPLAVGVGLVVFSALGILINRRPIGDIILMIVGGLALVGTVGYYVAQHWARQGREARAERLRHEEAAATWTSYSRPDDGDWVVGIERLVAGRQIDNREMSRFPGGDPPVGQRLDAEGEAIARAAQFNAARSTP